MDKSRIENRLLHDHHLHLYVVHTGEERYFTIKLHTDKKHKMTDRAAIHVMSTHAPPPPPVAPSPPTKAPRLPPKTKPNPYDTATYLGATLCAGRRTTDCHNRHDAWRRRS